MAHFSKAVNLFATAVMASLLFGGNAFGFQSPFAPDGNIVESCAYTTANLTNITEGAVPNFLGAWCLDDVDVPAFSYSYAWINLDYCVANSAGNIISSPVGNYSKTCTECSLSAALTGTVNTTLTRSMSMTCTCHDMSGGLQTATLDLAPIISTKNGTFICGGHSGTIVFNDTMPIDPNWG